MSIFVLSPVPAVLQLVPIHPHVLRGQTVPGMGGGDRMGDGPFAGAPDPLAQHLQDQAGALGSRLYPGEFAPC